jgi:hypothetical protein
LNFQEKNPNNSIVKSQEIHTAKLSSDSQKPFVDHRRNNELKVHNTNLQNEFKEVKRRKGLSSWLQKLIQPCRWTFSKKQTKLTSNTHYSYQSKISLDNTFDNSNDNISLLKKNV